MKSYDEVINIYPELNDKKSKKSKDVIIDLTVAEAKQLLKED